MKTLEDHNREAAAKMEQDRFVARAGRLLSRSLNITCSQARDLAKKMAADEVANLKTLLDLPQPQDKADRDKRTADEKAICQRAVDDLNARLSPKKAK